MLCSLPSYGTAARCEDARSHAGNEEAEAKPILLSRAIAASEEDLNATQTGDVVHIRTYGSEFGSTVSFLFSLKRLLHLPACVMPTFSVLTLPPTNGDADAIAAPATPMQVAGF